MPRRKPISSKQRKAELQLKRAIKRGDVPAPPPQPKPPRGKKRLAHGPAGEPSSKRLQSAFLKVEPAFLERSKVLAATEALPRPLSAETAILDAGEVGLRDADNGGAAAPVLTCPKRPKWRFDMAKKEVEKNEEGLFQKWMADVDARIGEWRVPPTDDDGPTAPTQAAPLLSPTYYERNLEVWRQLWRVTEISQIVLVLLDARCPALHLPPSLHAYLAALRPAPRPLILVLTKTDLVPASYCAAWAAWLRARYPSVVRVVSVESYRLHEGQEERKGQGQRRRFDPAMKKDELGALVEALQAAHAELLAPPERVRDDEEKLKRWRPEVREIIDWQMALRGESMAVEEPVDESGQEFITIGLVGQPNVGKSSLLNAIFGAHKVKASRTPGKTKHFQTLFWTPQIRLVDCPGLVMPNLVHMELQVLCGILPISQIPSIPACVHYALRLLPLEQIMHLPHPATAGDTPVDKRTWREERPILRPSEAATTRTWTTMDVLTAYAKAKGWVTAKAGRPDTNRAGNAILRSLAEGRVPWAFWPPEMPLPENHVVQHGIWLGGAVRDEAEEEEDSEADLSEAGSDGAIQDTELSNEDEEQEGEESEGEGAEDDGIVGAGRFDVLTLDTDADI